MTDRAAFLANIITQLGVGLTDHDARVRLDLGVRHTQTLTPKFMSQPLFNKVMIPIFTRTVYDRHGFDVPVITYVNKMVEYVEGCQWLTVDLTVIPELGIDREAEAMEKMAIEFEAHMDQNV